MLRKYKCISDYGYNPFKTLRKGLGVILFGGLFFWLANDHGFMVPTKEYVYMNKPYWIEENKGEQKYTEETPPPYPEFYSPIYSLEVFVPFLDLHQESYWIPGDNGRNETMQGKPKLEWYEPPKIWVHLLHIWMWLETIVGWFLSTFFVAGVVGLMHESYGHKKK
jgi:hypothetical protein